MLSSPRVLRLTCCVALCCTGRALAADDRPIYVLFTVDVESRDGGGPDRDIWGRLEGEPEEHGIGRMMDILDSRGAKGTFFVNVYEAPVSGHEAMAEVCRRRTCGSLRFPLAGRRPCPR